MSYEVGDMMYLKLRPYRQQSLAKRPFEKVSACYYGPFPVSKKIGKVAYQLDLPPQAIIHLVFHISQLKKALGQHTTHPTIPPQLTSDLTMEVTPEKC